MEFKYQMQTFDMWLLFKLTEKVNWDTEMCRLGGTQVVVTVCTVCTNLAVGFECTKMLVGCFFPDCRKVMYKM